MIILEIAMGILLFFGLVFVVLLCIAIYKVKSSNLPIKNRQIGPNSIQDIGEQVNATIIDEHGNKRHIN